MVKNIKPNFSRAYSKANEVLVKSHVITEFPFSTIDVVKELSEITLFTYGDAKKWGVDIRDFGSDSATIFEYGSRQIIFYNDNKPKSHINFSILHEFGHPVNNHDFSFINDETYGRYEIETNFFAAQILMPEQILRECISRGQCITTDFLIEHFGVSEIAAKKRIETLARTAGEWRPKHEKEFDDIILYKFRNFIDSICTKQKITYSFEDEYDLQCERESWIHSY